MGIDQQLLERLKSGNEDAWREVMKQNGPRVLRHAWAILGSQADAEDVFQEVFIRVFRFAGSFQGGSFAAWLHQITTNSCMNLLKVRRRISAQELTPFQQTVEVPETNSSEELWRQMQQLPVIDREILFLKIVEHLSYREIAEITGLAEGSLRNSVCKSLKYLREEWKTHELP